MFPNNRWALCIFEWLNWFNVTHRADRRVAHSIVYEIISSLRSRFSSVSLDKCLMLLADLESWIWFVYISQRLIIVCNVAVSWMEELAPFQYIAFKFELNWLSNWNDISHRMMHSGKWSILPPWSTKLI